MDYYHKAKDLHLKHQGKIQITPKVKIKDKTDLSWAYTPGVAAVSRLLAKQPELTGRYTFKGNSIAIVSDGSAVLGLGNIGPYGAYPVMEGKALLFKHFAGIDGVPLVINTQDPDKIIKVITALAPTFGGINLEDIAAPNCFYIEDKLKQILDIPVMHDDQWGTAVVVLAGLINAADLAGKQLTDFKVVIVGAGAAGSGVTKLLYQAGLRQLLVLDSKGIISHHRSDLNNYKRYLAKITNPDNITGNLKVALKGADVFIGVSRAGLLKPADVKLMRDKPIIFAMANPEPEILPDTARKAGAFVVATGRSDYPNQVNNALAFPGIFKGVLTHRIKRITPTLLIRAAQALAGLVDNPAPDKIIPSIFDDRIVPTLVDSLADCDKG